MPEDAPQSNAPATTSGINWKKIIGVVITILVAVTIIGGGIYWYVQSQTSTAEPTATTNTTPKDETADWKTFTNSKLGFSVKYPKYFGVKEYPKNSSGTAKGGVTFVSSDNNLYFTRGRVIYKDISINVRKASGGTLDEELKNVYMPSGTIFQSKSTIKIDGVEALRATSVAEGNISEEIAVVLKKGDNVYFFVPTWGGNPSDKTTILHILNLMLSTFKFN